MVKKASQAIGARIRKRRRELGLMTKDVSGYLGVKEWTLCHWESGAESIPAYQLVPLALILRCEAIGLLGK